MFWGLFPSFLFNISCFSFVKPFSLHLPRYEERSGWPSPLSQRRTSISLVILSLFLSVDFEMGTSTCTFRHSYTKTNAGTHTLDASGYESVRCAHSDWPPQLLTSLFCTLPWKLEQLQRGRLQVRVCFILFVHVCTCEGCVAESFVRRWASWPVRLISCWTEKLVRVY